MVRRLQNLALLQKVARPPGRQLTGTVQNIGTDTTLPSTSISILEGGSISISKETDGGCQVASQALSGLGLPTT